MSSHGLLPFIFLPCHGMTEIIWIINTGRCLTLLDVVHLVCLHLVEVSKSAAFLFFIKDILLAPICLSERELFLKLK